MTREQQRRGALDALDRILNRGGDADDVLRETVGVLATLYDAVAIDFVEGDDVVEGPSAGPRGEGAVWPIRFEGSEVARLTVAPASDEDAAFLDRVTTVVSAYCLVGWDTGGERWVP